jgi:hypothetical protein
MVVKGGLILAEKQKHTLQFSENKMLTKIFGPKKVDVIK